MRSAYRRIFCILCETDIEARQPCSKSGKTLQRIWVYGIYLFIIHRVYSVTVYRVADIIRDFQCRSIQYQPHVVLLTFFQYEV